jgi:hypothetical protein
VCILLSQPGGKDIYRDPAHNTNSNDRVFILYDPATYPMGLDGISATDSGISPKQDEKFPYIHFIPAGQDELFPWACVNAFSANNMTSRTKNVPVLRIDNRGGAKGGWGLNTPQLSGSRQLWLNPSCKIVFVVCNTWIG